MARILLIPLWLMLASVGLFAQASTSAQEQMTNELRLIRSTLERIEKTQNLLVTLERIRLNEQRVAALEAQRLQLLNQQTSLSAQVAAARSSGGSPRSSMIGTQVEDTGSSEASQGSGADQSRAAESWAQLTAVERSLKAIDQRLVELKRRIAEAEKSLQGF
ncbi:MAG TPA: hypothetical protein VN577_20450 [Terriglobales bacterium]|nr:hypothetical protein [Terriglobales bacterium]